jgi:hypothetical protein
MADQKTAWLIERDSPAEYLTMYGAYPEDEFNVQGIAGWSSVGDAIRFVRRRDAVMVLGMLRTLYGELPSKHGVNGLRPHDASPRICEHRWCDGPDLSSEELSRTDET